MHYGNLIRIFALLLMTFSLTNVPPLLVSIWYGDGHSTVWILSMLGIWALGFLLWLPTMRRQAELTTKEGFVITSLFWVVLAAAGAVPMYNIPELNLSVTDAFFESLSGLTTTGATVLSGLDQLPQSILWYRQQLQWLGGLGIVILAIAILPMLGVGGMQLYRTEIPGPMKDEKLTPRIATTAKLLWLIYVGFTMLCALAYRLAGMPWFDAITHSFSTVAIGGFSIKDTSLGHYDSFAIEMVAVVFMLLAAANFALHFSLFRKRSLKQYWRDPEYRFFLGSVMLMVLFTFVALLANQHSDWFTTWRHALFTAVSVHTTAGFGVTDFSSWPTVLPYLMIMAAFFGGCAGSTAGGIKVIRVVLLLKQGSREIKRMIHPNGVFSIRLGEKAIPEGVTSAVWGFFAVYVLVFAAMFFALLATGLDFETTWSVSASSLNNLGPALGEASSNWSSLNDTAKWILCVGMLLGRLEIFTVLILFSPYFWRQ